MRIQVRLHERGGGALHVYTKLIFTVLIVLQLVEAIRINGRYALCSGAGL